MTELQRQAQLVNARYEAAKPEFEEAKAHNDRMKSVQVIGALFNQILKTNSQLGATPTFADTDKFSRIQFYSIHLMQQLYQAFHNAPDPNCPIDFFRYLVSRKGTDHLAMGIELEAARELFKISSQLHDAVPNGWASNSFESIQNHVTQLETYKLFVIELDSGIHTQHLLPKGVVPAAEATVPLGGNPLPENRQSLGEKADFRRNGIRGGSDVVGLFSFSRGGMRR